MADKNIHNLPSPKDSRSAASGGSGGGDDVSARVAVLEAELKHLATKTDIANLQTWFIGVVFLILMQFVGLGLLIYRTFN